MLILTRKWPCGLKFGLQSLASLDIVRLCSGAIDRVGGY